MLYLIHLKYGFSFKLNRETGVTGKITVNGKNRSSNSENFRNASAYIHQDDALRPYLSVREAMTVAVHLKLGFKVTKEYKNKLVSSILAIQMKNKKKNLEKSWYILNMVLIDRFTAYLNYLVWKHDSTPNVVSYPADRKNE